MLILTRRPGEVLIIDLGAEKIEVVVLGVKGNQVRIGVTAPKAIPVNRKEVHDRMQQGQPALKAVANA